MLPAVDVVVAAAGAPKSDVPALVAGAVWVLAPKLNPLAAPGSEKPEALAVGAGVVV